MWKLKRQGKDRAVSGSSGFDDKAHSVGYDPIRIEFANALRARSEEPTREGGFVNLKGERIHRFVIYKLPGNQTRPAVGTLTLFERKQLHAMQERMRDPVHQIGVGIHEALHKHFAEKAGIPNALRPPSLYRDGDGELVLVDGAISHPIEHNCRGTRSHVNKKIIDLLKMHLAPSELGDKFDLPAMRADGVDQDLKEVRHLAAQILNHGLDADCLIEKAREQLRREFGVGLKKKILADGEAIRKKLYEK